MSVIAIFRGIYCSADQIAQQVADRLGYTVVGEDLLEQAAKRYGTSAEKLARAMTGTRAFFNAFTHEWEKSLIYVRAALAQMLGTDDQIYCGPAVHLLPREVTHVLRVGLTAEHDYRVREGQQKDGIDAREAASRIQKNNQDLARWTQHLLSRNPWDPDLYDIKIPLPSMSVQEAVEMICDSVAAEALKPTDESIQAVLDFQLATQINIELAAKGHYTSDVIAKRGDVTVVINQPSAPKGALARTVQALRFENVEEEAMEVVRKIEGVRGVEVRPGAGFRRPSRTLLVDDEQEYVVTLSERLQMRDIASDVAYDGEQALTYVKTDVPDVMVLDLRMPGMDGLEVLRRIKRDHPRVEVIIVTGHGSDRDEKIARELGAFDYMKKPVDIKVLAERIKEASRKAQGEP